MKKIKIKWLEKQIYWLGSEHFVGRYKKIKTLTEAQNCINRLSYCQTELTKLVNKLHQDEQSQRDILQRAMDDFDFQVRRINKKKVRLIELNHLLSKYTFKFKQKPNKGGNFEVKIQL